MSFTVTILGSGGAMFAHGRLPTSQLLQLGKEFLMIDCGEAIQHELLRAGFNLHKISAIFISHLHGDHYLGLPGLLFTMHLTRRVTPLHLYGPDGLDDIILTHLRHSRSALHFPIHFHSLQHGVRMIHQSKYGTITSFPLNHRLPCFGFLVEEAARPFKLRKELLPPGLSLQAIAKLRRGEDVYEEDQLRYSATELTWPRHKPVRYAFCSDTAYAETLEGVLTEIDVLYHEATFMETERAKADETFHSTASDAARFASTIQAKRLLLGHFSARYKELEPLLLEAQNIFPNCELALQGTQFTLSE